MNEGKTINLLSVFVAITYVGMIIVNSLANILPINGRGTGDISDSYENLFAPAAITFSIWILIYLLLFGYVVYQFKYYKDDDLKKIFSRVGILFSISSILNSIWIFAWHYDKILISLCIMAGILLSLIAINVYLRKKELSLRQYIFLRLPFTVYLGWITVATIANVTTYLVSIQWNQLGMAEYVWTVIILLTGAIIGLLAMLFYKSKEYGLVILWAYSGIAIKHFSETGFNGEYISVIITVFISLLVLLAGEVVLVRRSIGQV
jgi:hypothetical protein